MVNDELGAHLGDKCKFTFTKFGYIRRNELYRLLVLTLYIKGKTIYMHTRPESTCLTDNKANMLRAFLHLTSKIEGSGKHQIRIGLANLILSIESFEVYLSGRDGLLPSGHALSQFDKF